MTLKSELLIRQRDWDGGLATRERAAFLDPLNPEAGVNLAMAYAERDRWEEANAAFDRVLEVHPTFFEWLMTADADGKVAALEKIDQPTLVFGGFWWAPRALLEGWTYEMIDLPRAEKAFEEAVEACLEALEDSPDDPRVYASLGRAYAGLGMRAEAVREAERVVEILPMSVDPSFGRDLLEIVAHIYAALGMAEESADALEEVLSVPVVPPMFALLGTEFERVRDHPRIQAIIERYRSSPLQD